MKYAKSDKGYYVPKGKAQGSTDPNTESAAMANTGDPVRSDTSLSWQDAGYAKTKDQYGNDLYLPSGRGKSGMLDYAAGKNDRLYMKAFAYLKNPDGTFKPVVYDMQNNQVDEFLTSESVNTLTGGLQESGSTSLKPEAVGKLLYKHAIRNYQPSPIDNKQKSSQSVSSYYN